jgi:hypothetical protein
MTPEHGLTSFLKRAAREIADGFSVDIPQVPVDDIGFPTVASAIEYRIRHGRELGGGDPDDHWFPVEAVMAAMGYDGGWQGDRYREDAPEAFVRTEKTLIRLVEAGVLVEERMEDRDGEYWYRLADPQKLSHYLPPKQRK